MTTGRMRCTLAGVAAAVALTACSGTNKPTGVDAATGTPASTPATSAAGPTQPAPAGQTGHAGHAAAPPAPARPLREQERFVKLTMPAPYTPSAPYGTGTDDYRCFILDPHLAKDAFITGLDILPGTPAEVHHVILFRAPPETVKGFEAQDAGEKGEGWTCFGGTGLETDGALDDAPWLGAWAPGGSEQVMAGDVGVPLAKGSRVIMQVHYNLLAGSAPDVSTTRLRIAPTTKELAPLQTMLLPAPVELPCRPAHDDGPLCERTASLADVQRRFGQDVGMTANFLHLLCGQVRPGRTQSCDRTLSQPATIRAVAGHMHLLGRSLTIQVNPGRPEARTLLDIPTWDFDNQGARRVPPVHLSAGDTVRVTCRHDQRLRDLLPSFKGQPDKYVLWGEGTTDEMCLGILLVTRP
jgi:hypothetical protein